MQFLLVSKEHPFGLPKLVLPGKATPTRHTLLLAPGKSQLTKERNGLPVPVQDQDVILVHHWIVAAPNGLHTVAMPGLGCTAHQV